MLEYLYLCSYVRLSYPCGILSVTLYFLSVTVNLLKCSWFPIHVNAGLLPLCCQICLGTCTLNKTQNGYIMLKISIYFSGLLYRGISSLIKFIAWLLKQLGWQNREGSKMEKLFTACEIVLLPDRKTISYCSALNCLFYTLCS